MVIIVNGALADAQARVIDTMFEDRKRLFVDLLGWTVPVVDERFEKDCYDGDRAVYLIALDEDGAHAGSMRLLPTTGAHILGDLFPTLCDQDVPRGPSTFEITRLCLPTRYGAAGRFAIRNRLISAMVDYALAERIDVLTGVVEVSFLSKVLEMGWDCEALGSPQRVNGSLLGAFQIAINEDTPARLAARGNYTSGTIRACEHALLAA